MPPATANLQTAWAFLEKGIDHIMRNSTPTGVSFTHANYDPSHTPINIVQSIQLSTVVYNYMRTSEFTSEEKIGRCE
jgi:hypothetical protein